MPMKIQKAYSTPNRLDKKRNEDHERELKGMEEAGRRAETYTSTKLKKNKAKNPSKMKINDHKSVMSEQSSVILTWTLRDRLERADVFEEYKDAVGISDTSALSGWTG